MGSREGKGMLASPSPSSPSTIYSIPLSSIIKVWSFAKDSLRPLPLRAGLASTKDK